jgi:hypothetical protein
MADCLCNYRGFAIAALRFFSWPRLRQSEHLPVDPAKVEATGVIDEPQPGHSFDPPYIVSV